MEQTKLTKEQFCDLMNRREDIKRSKKEIQKTLKQQAQDDIYSLYFARKEKQGSYSA